MNKHICSHCYKIILEDELNNVIQVYIKLFSVIYAIYMSILIVMK